MAGTADKQAGTSLKENSRQKDRTQPVDGSLAKTPLWERPAPDEIQLIENTWAVNSTTDIRKLIIKRFNIPLTWLDLKRVQLPLSPEEERFVHTNITSKETFQPGWLNDEVVNFYFALLEETTSIKGNVIHFSSFFYETLNEGKIQEILRWRKTKLSKGKG